MAVGVAIAKVDGPSSEPSIDFTYACVVCDWERAPTSYVYLSGAKRQPFLKIMLALWWLIPLNVCRSKLKPK